MRHNPAKTLILILTISFLGGCAVGPDYAPPETHAPTAWHSELHGGLTEQQTDPHSLVEWWSTLNDPLLSSLIERAVSNNLDLKDALARVREARARRLGSRAGLFPTADANASARSSRSSEETGSGNRTELYSAGFDASWEIDIFGGKRRDLEAANADLEASKEDYYDTMVSLVAEVALNYVDIRVSQKRIAITEENITSQTESYDLARWRAEAGLASELDVEQARYNLENTRSQLPLLHSRLEANKNSMAVLLGGFPGDLHEILNRLEAIPITPATVAVGIPAEVLRRRPDIRRAERQLAAQTARIGVATADLYPKFSLLGSIGLEALTGGDLFSGSSGSNSASAKLNWPIFDAGAIRANIEVQNARQEQTLISYESTLRTAIRDVENAMVAFAQEQQRLKSLIKATAAAQRAVDLALTKYSSGLIDFRDVLEAQRSLRSFQDQTASSKGEVTSDLIRLYKALGGGWEPLLRSSGGNTPNS